MATNKTPNLQMDSWAAADYFKRAELNGNFDKIDAKVGEVDGRLGEHDAQLAEKAQGKFHKSAGTDAKPNIIHGSIHNKIADDVESATISGGGMGGGFENVIGGNTANVGTANSNAEPMLVGSGANIAVIGGGYDNVVNALAAVVTGYHCKVEKGATHATINGGSYQSILSGDYTVIGGGTVNKITASYATIGGGANHEANGNASTVSGGSGNKANGANNTISGGFGSTSSGDNSTIGGGYQQNASGTASTIAGGYQQVASGTYTAIGGGFKNVASGSYASVLGGRENEAASPYSSVIGRDGKSSIEGEFVQSQGSFATKGDSQLSRIPLRKQTTTATTALMGAGAGTAALNLPVGSTWGFTCIVTARRIDVDGESAMWEIKGLAQRGDTGSTALVGTPIITEIGKSAGANWTVSMRTSGYQIVFDVTGEDGKTINWLGRLDINQLIG